MLAAYFKQYPPHLAKIAKRQADSRSLPPPSPRPDYMMEDSPPEDSAPSDSGRTYTISEQSEEQIESREKSKSPESDSKLQKSHSLDPKGGKQSPTKEKPLAFDFTEEKSPSKDTPLYFDVKERTIPSGEGPFSLGAKEGQKSPFKDGPLSLDLTERKDRPLTLDLKDKKGPQESSRSPTNRISKDSPSILDNKTKKSPRSPTKDGPISLDPKKDVKAPSAGSKRTPPKHRSPLSDLFKSKTIPDASVGRKSPIKDKLRKSPVERKFKERSVSLEETVSLCHSHIDPKYPSLKTSLKDLVPEEIPEMVLNENKEPEHYSSSDEECLSTTTCNRHSPQNESSSPKINNLNSTEPNLTRGNIKTKSNSLPTSHDHPNGGSCPMHNRSTSHSPPVDTRPSLRASSTSSSARSSAAESQLLNCGICSQKFHHPKVLPCLHTFCEDCLVSYTPEESLTLTCPLCRQQSILPKDGVSGLQANTWVSSIIEAIAQPPSTREPCSSCGLNSTRSCIKCDVLLCDHCTLLHTQDSTSDEHSVVSLDDVLSQTSSEHHEDTTLYCSSHAGQTLRFYCRTCETAVCASCTAIEHRDHTTMRLTEAVEDQKLGLHKLMEKVMTQLPCVKEVLCDLGDISNQLDTKRHDAENQIRNSFQTLHDVLGNRQTELLNTLNTVVTRKKNSIEDQKLELEEWISGVESGCEYVDRSLANCPPMEVVLVKKQLGEKLNHYAEAKFPPVPKENAHLQFIPGSVDPLKNAFKNVGIIQTNSAVPQQTTAVGNALKSTLIGRQILVTVVTRDHKGDRVTTGGAQVSAKISRCKTSQNGCSTNGTNGEHTDEHCPYSRTNSCESEIEPRVIDLQNGNYEVTFSLHKEGIYKLSLHLFGQHINASPFTIQAHSTDTESSDQGSVNGGRMSYHRQTSRSTQITKTSRTSKTSRSKAPSHKSSCSRRTNPIEDDLIFKVGSRGRNRGEFVNPQGICYAPIKDGRIVLADSNNQCVQVFTMTGECKVKFGTRGRSVGQMQRPTGVAALPNGNYAIADYENRWISIFEPNGKYVSRIGHGKLLGPKGLCVNAQGNLIVVDNKASCVCIFSPSGKLLTKFGNRIVEGYNFAGPHFCAVNSRGDIIVTDFHNHCVRVFDCEGVSLFTFGTSGEGNGQFNAPTGVAIDHNDNIIVADWGNSRIQIFDSQGSFLTFVNTQVDPLYGPQGLSLTADGNILVADSGNHCFKLYKYLQ